MARFDLLFPTFIAKAAELHELLRPVTFLLFVVGTILLSRHRFSARSLLLHLVRLLILTSLLVYLPTWGNEIQSLLESSIVSGLGVDPRDIHSQYVKLIVAKRDMGTGVAWWDLLGHLSGFSVETLITGVLWLFGHFASLLLFWAYIIQKIVLFVGYALAPIPIGFMAIPALRATGGRYLLNLTGVLVWPIGWGVAALITQGILDFMTDPSLKFLEPTAVGYHLQTALGMGVLAFWIAFSTVASPVLIQRVFTSGALMGGELMGQALGGFLQTAATTAGAASVAGSVGIPAITAATAAPGPSSLPAVACLPAAPGVDPVMTSRATERSAISSPVTSSTPISRSTPWKPPCARRQHPCSLRHAPSAGLILPVSCSNATGSRGSGSWSLPP